MRLTCITLLLAMTPLSAHHATRAVYDASKTVTIRGIVTHADWLNPHGHFFLDVKDGAGNVVGWDVETVSPHALLGQGCTKSDLQPGSQLTVDVWLAKDGSHRAYMRVLTLADGRAISGQSPWDDPPLRRQ